MKKLIIIIIMSIAFINPVFAEKINTDELIFGKMRFSPTENPVTYNYFVEYADMLRSKIDFNKYKRYWGMEYRYKVHTDGTISDLKPMILNTPYEGTKINRYFEGIILNNPPPPYPENMEIGDVYVKFYAEADLKDETHLYFLRANDGALYPGNNISIRLYGKTFPNVVRGAINYTLDKLFGF